MYYLLLLNFVCNAWATQIQTVDYKEPSISALFFSIDSICNIHNDYQQNTDLLINDLTKYFSICSRGKITLSQQSLMVKGINIPCTGNNSIACGVDDLSSWVKFSKEYAVHNQININNYNHFILLLPQMPFCNWGGLATLAPCIPSCYVWINGNTINKQSAFLHEIGHNLGLFHAATYGNDYGDTSCAMGAYASNRCYNVMSQARLNWNYPIQIIQLNPNQMTSVIIPSSLSSDFNYISLTLNSSDSLLISFRTGNIGFDANLYSMYINRLSIHHVKGLNAIRAYLVYILPVQSTWNGQAYFDGLSVTFSNYKAETSYVDITTGVDIPSIPCGDHVCHITELNACPIDCTFPSTLLTYCF